jgi:hypothetical protein
MSLGVRERALALATFRAVEVRLMETLAAWIPNTPEMEAKVLLGQHVWDAAQHADALGRRTLELRAPLHFTRPPADAYRAVLDALAGEAATPRRLGGLYDALLPGLAARYRAYLGATDALLDAPSVRIVEGILRDLERMCAEGRALQEVLPALRADAVHAARLREAEQAVPELVQPESPPAGERAS